MNLSKDNFSTIVEREMTSFDAYIAMLNYVVWIDKTILHLRMELPYPLYRRALTKLNLEMVKAKKMIQ